MQFYTKRAVLNPCCAVLNSLRVKNDNKGDFDNESIVRIGHSAAIYKHQNSTFSQPSAANMLLPQEHIRSMFRKMFIRTAELIMSKLTLDWNQTIIFVLTLKGNSKVKFQNPNW